MPASIKTRRVSLAHLTVIDAPAPEFISAAASAGFAHVGLRLTGASRAGDPAVALTADEDLLRQTQQRLADTGLTVIDVEGLRIETHGVTPHAERFYEVASRLGATDFVVMSSDTEERRIIDRFGEICTGAAAYGLRPSLEFASWSGVTSLAQASRVVAACNGGGILVDALHLSRSFGTPEQVRKIDPVRLFYFQLNDAPAQVPEALQDRYGESRKRLLPGDGGLPLAELIAAFPEDALISVEAPCAALASLPVTERARLAWEATQRVLSRIHLNGIPP